MAKGNDRALVLLNMTQFADRIGRDRTYVSAMKRAGWQPDYGMKTTLACGLSWLKANPDFRVTQVYPRKRKRLASKPVTRLL